MVYCIAVQCVYIPLLRAVLCTCSSYKRNYLSCMSPTLSRSSEIQHFECSDTIEILIFEFYMGLSHNLILRRSTEHLSLSELKKLPYDVAEVAKVWFIIESCLVIVLCI